VKRDTNKAKDYAEQILKSDPGDVDGRYFRGRVALAEGNVKSASEEFSYVTRNAPRFAAGFYYLGLAQLKQSQLQGAKASLVKATELSPLWVQPRLMLARLYLTMGEHDLAWEQTEKILHAQPKNQQALHLAGTAQLRKGQPAKALDLFERAQELDPQDPASRVNIAAVYALQKKYPQALHEYEEVLKVAPDFIPAVQAIARIYQLQGNPRAGIERVRQHLTKTKNQAPLYQVMAHLSAAAKDYAKGLEYSAKAIELNPDLLSSYFLIARIYAAQRKFDEAIEQHRKIVQLNPKAVGSYMLLGILHDTKKEHKKANEYYQKVLDIDKNFAPAANNLAWNYAEYGGNLEIALSLAQKAREMQPEDPNIADTLGWIYYKKAIYDRAIGLLRESNEKLEGKNPTVLYHLGAAYYKVGDVEKAREALTRAVKLNDSFPGAAEAKRILSTFKG
ncbi:MAG TPA: tetratricopeptide repeat protein, partial [Candidatus Acidoferrales bacterium]|nr:tetratricopeptide repeat protein [Candidatus Acidoferrales bacterium]